MPPLAAPCCRGKRFKSERLGGKGGRHRLENKRNSNLESERIRLEAAVFSPPGQGGCGELFLLLPLLRLFLINHGGFRGAQAEWWLCRGRFHMQSVHLKTGKRQGLLVGRRPRLRLGERLLTQKHLVQGRLHPTREERTQAGDGCSSGFVFIFQLQILQTKTQICPGRQSGRALVPALRGNQDGSSPEREGWRGRSGEGRLLVIFRALIYCHTQGLIIA